MLDQCRRSAEVSRLRVSVSRKHPYHNGGFVLSDAAKAQKYSLGLGKSRRNSLCGHLSSKGRPHTVRFRRTLLTSSMKRLTPPLKIRTKLRKAEAHSQVWREGIALWRPDPIQLIQLK